MKILTIILISVLLSAPTFAVTPLKKGQPAPETGYLFSKAEEKQLRKNNEQRKLLEKLSFKQSELIKNQHEQISILKSERKLSTLQKTVYFIGGVFATGMSVYLAGKLVRN